MIAPGWIDVLLGLLGLRSSLTWGGVGGQARNGSSMSQVNPALGTVAATESINYGRERRFVVSLRKRTAL